MIYVNVESPAMTGDLSIRIYGATACGSRYQPHFCVAPTTMSPEAARDLSITDLHALNEKLGLECTKLQGTPLPPAVSAASLEPEVSTSRSVNVEIGSNSSELHRLKASKVSARCSEVHPLPTEHVATGQLGATGDPISNRSGYPR